MIPDSVESGIGFKPFGLGGTILLGTVGEAIERPTSCLTDADPQLF
jgi:hypothetical protein